MVVLALLSQGCVSLEDKPASVAWHSVYRSIDDQDAYEFLKAGLELLRAMPGEPEIPISEIKLRHSIKNHASSHYRVAIGFSKTEIVDPGRGVFCIYISVPPSHQRFYYLLGHEIGHLLRPSVMGSPAEERFCNEFARQLCERQNKPWSADWENREWVRRH